MANESMITTLRKLSEAIGISGYEQEPRDIIVEEIESMIDKAWVDPLGNLLAIRKGDKKHPRILLDAHIDEIGFIVKYIHDSGYLRIAPIGGWDPRLLPSQRVVLQVPSEQNYSRVFGVIGATPPHLTTAKEREKVIPVEELFVDIGITSREKVEALGIRIGTPLTVWQPFIEPTEGVVTGKAFDDRVGCLIIIEILRRIAKSESLSSTLVMNFAVAEEIGGRGARTGTYTLEPDVALALECTSAGDMPGIPEHKSPTQLGKGPAITVADRSLITHPHVLKTLEETAKKNQIPFQYKQPLIGGTNGGPISQTRGGVPTGVVSVPCRYIHSAISLLQTQDLAHTIDLVYYFIQAWQPKEGSP